MCLCPKWVQYISYIVDIKLVDALDKLIMNNIPSLNGKIEIRDSQCNLRCKAINIFITYPLGPDNILKMTSSQYSEMTLAS